VETVIMASEVRAEGSVFDSLDDVSAHLERHALGGAGLARCDTRRPVYQAADMRKAPGWIDPRRLSPLCLESACVLPGCPKNERFIVKVLEVRAGWRSMVNLT
jgi:hypothetical protein